MENNKNKTKTIHVRLSEEEYYALSRKVKYSGLNISAFVRRAANNRRITSRVEMHVVNELRKLGGLLKLVHNESGGAYRHATAAAIDEIRKAVRRLDIDDR